MAVLGAWLKWPFALLLAERGRLFPWCPVCLGIGIGVWFALARDPGLPVYGGALALVLLAVAARLWFADIWHAPLFALGFVALGLLACGARVWVVQAPVMEFRYYGPVTGRITGIDRSQTDALRITLDRVWLDRVAPERTPAELRISLRGREPGHDPFPGEVVMTTARLAAPGGPVEPGGFDFRRMAYFQRLGAVGYTTGPLVLWEGAAPGARPIDRLRSHLSQAMMAAMPSQAGAFAAGAMTGDRSGIRAETVDALRDSSLAHILAISGMNLAFLIAFVFALFRYGLALIPAMALRVNTKKVAALVSLGVAGFYLALSGSNVATERAFIMVSVMLGAVLLDRKALTLRSVAIAGMVLLLWKPESLLDAGFQMSFAATVALIAGFRAVDRRIAGGRMPKWAMPVFTLILSSVIGGFATAPYAAASFNRFADYGLIANLLTVPVMGAVVMPAGAMAALLAPFGLAGLPLWVMEWGAAWILMIAHWVAGWAGSVTAVPTPGPGAVPVITMAGIWLVLVRGRARWAALPAAAIGVALWAGTGRPAVLIASDGRLVGVLGPEGRALSATRGAGFAAENWLANDGDLATQDAAARRPGMEGPESARVFALGRVRGVVLKGRGAEAAAAAHCATVDLVVLPVELTPDTARQIENGGCRLFDARRLTATGAIALYPGEGGLRIVAAIDIIRVWSPARRPPPEVLAAIEPRGEVGSDAPPAGVPQAGLSDERASGGG